MKRSEFPHWRKLPKRATLAGVQVICSKCGRPVDGADIDIASRLAVCRPCGEVLSLEPALPTAPLALRSPDALFRPTDLSWIEERRAEHAWRVTIRPRRAQAILQLVLALLWTGFVLTFILLMRGPLFLLAFTLVPLIGVGCFAAYRALYGLNRMVVDVDSDRVTATRGPVPELNGVVREPTVNVVGFKPISQPLQARGGHLLRWGLHLLTRDGRAIPIRMGLTEGSHANYAAARLTQMLVEARQGKAPYRE